MPGNEEAVVFDRGVAFRAPSGDDNDKGKVEFAAIGTPAKLAGKWSTSVPAFFSGPTRQRIDVIGRFLRNLDLLERHAHEFRIFIAELWRQEAR